MKVFEWIGKTLYPLEEDAVFSQFYESTYKNTFRYVMALCGGVENLAEDITAETYMRAWKNRKVFHGDRNAAFGWILTIARHLLVDHYRSSIQAPPGIEDADSINAIQPNVESILVSKELTSQVIQTLQSLPVNQREMLVLRYVLGWRVNRIAGHMEMPENTVSVSIHRSLKRIQELLLLQGVSYERQE